MRAPARDVQGGGQDHRRGGMKGREGVRRRKNDKASRLLPMFCTTHLFPLLCTVVLLVLDFVKIIAALSFFSRSFRLYHYSLTTKLLSRPLLDTATPAFSLSPIT